MTSFRSRIRSALGALLLGLATLVAAGDAYAQASIGGSIVVLLPPTTGAGIRPLDFGNVPLGATVARTITSDVDSTAAGIGHFNFTGLNGNRDVQLTFDFPASLTHLASGNSMPITFAGSFGLHCFNRQSGAHVCTLFNPSPGGADPSVLVITPPPPPRNGILRVYLGGSVTAPASLAAGVYQGTITLTMVRL